MTDAEMEKAMEICKNTEIPCNDCPLAECNDCERISLQYFYDRFKQLKSENAALRERLERTVELPYSHLEMLKLLTCASICYAEIKNLIVARMAKSRDVADLFMECPTVQGTTLDLALYRLSESNLDCNKIKGFEEVINATGSFKDYLAKAEARLAELKGGAK